MRNVTSHKTDIYLMLCAGFVSLYIGADMAIAGFGRVGGAILFIGVVNLFNAWRIHERESKKSE